MMHHKEGALLEKRPRQAPGDGTRSTGAGPPSAGATVRGETHQREKRDTFMRRAAAASADRLRGRSLPVVSILVKREDKHRLSAG